MTTTVRDKFEDEMISQMGYVVDSFFTPEFFANVFWEMSDIEQANFFNELAKIVKNKNSSFQWANMRDNLNISGKLLIKDMYVNTEDLK